MEPDLRHRQISDIYHAALARNPAEREAFVRNASDGDEALRREVESLLQDESQSSGFLESPAAVMAGALEGAPAGRAMAGRQLGPYTIVAPLGAGGMGEVYRARDTKLGRDVAIKILPSHFTNDPERRARFAREARTLATLNHPHIGAIYGLEESDGLSALVLELVEGQTLAERLERGPLPIADALPIARQIADALDAAHEKGIVHRDLKPANVVLQGSSGGAGRCVRRCSTSAWPNRGSGSRRQSHTIRLIRRHRGWTDSRHVGLHEPGAGARADGRQAHRYLGVRLRAVRDADRASRVRGRNHHGHACPSARTRTRLDETASSDAALDPRAARPLPAQGSPEAAARHR